MTIRWVLGPSGGYHGTSGGYRDHQVGIMGPSGGYHVTIRWVSWNQQMAIKGVSSVASLNR